MDKAKLSRRQVLAGLAVTGSSGALVGSGTSALFSDTETFANNALEASESVAGVVALDVGIDSMGDDEVCFDITLPENNEQVVGNNEPVVGNNEQVALNNNPSYVWVRVDSCPEPPEVDGGPAISWIAFCGDDITDSDVTLEISSVDEEGDPTEIDWNVDTTDNTTVKFVRWKLGNGAVDCDSIREMDVPNSSSGTIGGCEGSGTGTDVGNSTPCPDNGGLKYENDGPNNGLPSIPCKSINTFDTDIKLYLECPEDDKTIAEDGVRTVLDELREGVLLSCGEEDACLQPKDTRTLCIERTSDNTCEFDEIRFELLFYGQQCRYSSGPENPFDDQGPEC